MNKYLFYIICIYCGICRYAFEFGSVVMAFFLFSKPLFIVILFAFLLWQILGFSLVIEIEKRKKLAEETKKN